MASPLVHFNEEDDNLSVVSASTDNHDPSHDTATAGPNNHSSQSLFAKAEDTAVRTLRLFVLFVLMGAAVGISVGVYLYLDRSEETAFDDQFASDAAKVLEEIGQTLDNTLGPADALVVNLIAYNTHAADNSSSGSSSRSFPFVTLPSYGLQATKMLRNSKAFQIQIGLVVAPWQAEEWKDFADAHHQEWIDEALDIERTDPDWKGVIPTNYSRCYDMYSLGGTPLTEPHPELGFYSPNWLEFPIMSGVSGNGGCPYNYDFTQFPDVAAAIGFMKSQQKAVIGNFPSVNFDVTDPEQAMQKKIFDDYVGQFVAPGVDASEPYTQAAIPIFDKVDSVYVNVTQQQNYVGHVALWIQFRAWIENILPEQSIGVIIVVEQSCGEY